jgi:uncharacterized protein (DUF1499 family)
MPALLAVVLACALVVGGFPALLAGVIASRGRSAPAPRALTLAALAAAALLLLVFGFWARRLAGVPPIHDISTDLADPPAFVAVVPLRERSGAVNPPAYLAEAMGRDGPIDVADAQRRRYPTIRPAHLDLAPAEAFARADRAARAMGWDIVASVPDEGRIEATHTSCYFGFADDIVLRVRADGMGSRVDVRSKSRVGRSDLGANAARVHDYLDALARQ